MSRLVVIAFLIFVCLLLWQFSSGLSWVNETVLGGLPCVLRVEHDYESYATATHPGLCGFTIEYVKTDSPPLLTFSLWTVPQGDRLVSGMFTMGETEASVQFRPLWLPPRSPLRITVDLQEGPEDLLLNCREVRRGGRIRERVVIQTHHRYGRSLRENMANWVSARVAPFVLPGFDGILILLLLVAPFGGGLILLCSVCCCGDSQSGSV
jgi:hypothetical protein